MNTDAWVEGFTRESDWGLCHSLESACEEAGISRYQANI